KRAPSRLKRMPDTGIHATAIVSSEAEVAPGVEIGPFTVIEAGARLARGERAGPHCTIGGQVSLGEGCELLNHVAVAGRTTIGARTRIFPFASLRYQPQDLKYAGEPSTLSIGSDCQIREGVTMNPGTSGGGMA